MLIPIGIIHCSGVVDCGENHTSNPVIYYKHKHIFPIDMRSILRSRC